MSKSLLLEIESWTPSVWIASLKVNFIDAWTSERITWTLNLFPWNDSDWIEVTLSKLELDKDGDIRMYNKLKYENETFNLIVEQKLEIEKWYYQVEIRSLYSDIQ